MYAFPHVTTDQYRVKFEESGMTLRDYFAGQTIAGYLASFGGTAHFPKSDSAAKFAYDLADEMLKAREARSGI